MKSITSRSLAPPLSCSRIWFLRSTASGAFESASVWFWHTRQRSSFASAAARRSISESWPKAPSEMTLKSKSHLATALQFLHQRLELRARDLGRERSDVLVANHAALVDDVGLRHAVDPIVDRDAPGGVVDRELVRIAVALEPRQRILARVLVVKSDDR